MGPFANVPFFEGEEGLKMITFLHSAPLQFGHVSKNVTDAMFSSVGALAS